MESWSKRRTGEKRCYEESREDDGEDVRRRSKKPNLTALASVIVDALKVDNLQRLCSSLEPLLRKIVSEEVERALSKLGHSQFGGRSSPLRIRGHQEKRLQLHFRSRMPPHVFTAGKVEGEHGAPIHVVLLDGNTGRIVQEGPEAVMKLNVVALEGDFNDEIDDDWTKEHFEIHEVKEREGKRPLLTGDTQVTLKEGVGTLGDLTFTDNSSWIRSRKFRIGVKVAPGTYDGIRVREGKTDAFPVKDHRGELYKKHYPPALHDKVWRLDRIAKDGALHKKLVGAEIVTVEDFLRVLVRDPQKLRSILGSGMSNKMWENTVDHAKTCVLGGKLYVFYTDATHSTGAVFNHIYEFTGLITNGKFLSLESLSHNQKVSVDLLIKRAYENWNLVIEYDGKVLLNSLSNGTQGMDDSPATGNICQNAADTCSHTSIQMQQYTPSDSGIRFQNVNIQFSHLPTEFPSTRSNPTVKLALTTPAMEPRSNVDHHSVEMSLLLGSNQPGPGHWSCSQNGHGLEQISEEIRYRSSEMLENEEMQRLLKPFSIGVGALENGGFYACSTSYDHQAEPGLVKECGCSSGKALVRWLKLKAALRWGIFVRKRAAEKRAQLVELE